MSAPNRSSTAKRNLLATFDYLLHMDRMRSRPMFRLSDHKLPFFHEHAFAGLPGVETNLLEGEQEVWLSIRRLQAIPPPAPHDRLRPWINIPNDPGRKPTITESVVIRPDDLPPIGAVSHDGPGSREDAPRDASIPGRPEVSETGQPGPMEADETAPEVIELRPEDVPDIQAMFDRYLAERWTPWSETEQPRRNTIRKYDQFFSLLQDAETGSSAEDGIEIAWGIGVALWEHEASSESVIYPVLSRTVELNIDAKTMSITVTPTEREPVVHVDAFAALEIPQATDVEKRALAEFGDAELTLSPFDPATFEGILRFAASHLDSHGVYWPDDREEERDRSLPSLATHLVVTDTWVMYARKRSTNFIAADIKRLRQVVEDAEGLPPAPALVVTEPPNQRVTRQPRRYRGISTPGLGGRLPGGRETGDSEDLFFPKPFNAEQVAIVSRLDQADGVVVQGPPGTGKTHTIANIISHYLALGKKVLVTAQHEAPLAVLQDQIPEPLRPLTISLLSSERQGLKQLEQSVRKIASEVSTVSEGYLEQEIRAESDRIDRLHQQLEGLDRELRDWAAKQTAATPFLGEGTRPEKLARRVIEQEAEHRWFPDLLAGEEQTIQRFTEEDVAELRAAREELGEDLIYLGQVLPRPDALPMPEDIVQLHGDLQRLQQLDEAVFRAGDIPPLRQYTTEHLRQAEILGKYVEEAQVLLQAGSRHEWQRKARPLLRQSADSPVAHHFRQWLNAVLKLERKRQDFLGDALEIPAEAETHPDLYEAVQRAAQGKSPFGWFGGDKTAKALLKQIQLRAAAPRGDDDWKRVLEYLEVARTASHLAAQWNQIREEFGGPEVTAQALAAVKPMADIARPLVALWRLDTKLAEPLTEKAKEVFAAGIELDSLTDSFEALEGLRKAVDAHLQYSRLKAAGNTRLGILDLFDRCQGPVADQIRGFVGHSLGQETIPADRVMDEWRGLTGELRRLQGLEGALAAVDRVTEMIDTCGGHLWALKLRVEPPEEAGDQWLPREWRAAWEWARAKGYLATIDGREALRRLAYERARAEEDLHRAYLKVVELRTWRQLKRNLTPKVSAALNAYLTAVTRIGKGTGIRATRYRRDARNAMANAYGATPCWIMAHWRVSESLPPELGMFDLLIIDEASQSDVWALPSIARARKILVVGDDKQVSPSDVGVKEADVGTLRARFLSELPYGEHLLPGSSIYDLGSTMFASDIIRLREHFRCVEPIIAFSNRQFYDGEIKPLRVPKPSERLDPPLIDVHIKGGYRSARKKINKPEADTIVEEIRKISEDPDMARKTIGVVSLLGADQAKHIQEKLLDELGEDVILRHNIRCGDAMHFQGKEADIVMISMVASDSIRADSGRLYEQRYNVASSRARDRLYVFRSFSRAEVRDNDLRARLLDHLSHPFGIETEQVTEPRDLCESDFEREVYDELVGQGYRVMPQVRAGGYRIDLVVEGTDDRRLAIECDGDQYHSVDRWMDDITRQRTLERMGWRFWRCWASSWIASREECVSDLIGALETRGIAPGAGTREAPDHRCDLVEHRVIESPIPKDEAVPEQIPAPAPQSGEPTAPAWAGSETSTKPPLAHEGPATTLVPPCTVDVDDLVTYVDVDHPDQILTDRIGRGDSHPDTGVIDERTPLGEALLGAEEGDTVEAHLPMGTTKFQILRVQRRKVGMSPLPENGTQGRSHPYGNEGSGKG